MPPAIRLEELTKDYAIGFWRKRPYRALDRISLTIEPGEVFGFLGPNGAGKTTTLKLLMQLIFPTSGRAEILGQPVGHVPTRQRIGFLPESPYFYDYLTADEFLRFYGRLAGMDGMKLQERITALLQQLGLAEARHRQLRKFSKGMLQRVGLAQALIHDPELVIFDEPMSGLDPIGRRDVRDLMLNLRDQGKTVFFSTHIIPDVETICDRVAVVVKGAVVASGRVDELVGHGKTQSVEVVCEGIPKDRLVFEEIVPSKIVDQGAQCLLVLPDRGQVDEVLAKVRAMGGKLISVTSHKGSLEELFVRHVQLKV